MNKAELIADMKSKVVQIVKEHAPTQCNADVDGKRATDYSYTIVYPINGLVASPETDITIKVFNEGEPNEIALYNNNLLPVGKSDIEVMVGLAHAIDPGVKVLSSPAEGVWKVKFSNGVVKLAALNSSKTGFVDIETE